jgi:hypothetical protein
VLAASFVVSDWCRHMEVRDVRAVGVKEAFEATKNEAGLAGGCLWRVEEGLMRKEDGFVKATKRESVARLIEAKNIIDRRFNLCISPAVDVPASALRDFAMCSGSHRVLT